MPWGCAGVGRRYYETGKAHFTIGGRLSSKYHLFDRVVNRDHVLGQDEKNMFVYFMRKYADFHDVQVLSSYCIMKLEAVWYRMMLFSDGEEIFSSKPESGIKKIQARRECNRKEVDEVLAKGGNTNSKNYLVELT